MIQFNKRKIKELDNITQSIEKYVLYYKNYLINQFQMFL